MQAMRGVCLIIGVAQASGFLLRDDPAGNESVRYVFKGNVLKDRDTHGRYAYFDLGANWANTLRLYKDVAPTPEAEHHPWEVYAFEASPLIVPYVDDFVSWLNGDAPKPRLLWPPAGSSQHLALFAKRYGCPPTPVGRMRECMWNRFKGAMDQMVPNTTLMTPEVISARMAYASRPAQGKDRFVLVPAAAGAQNGSLHIGHVSAQQMIRGGAHSLGVNEKATGEPEYDVPLANFVEMLSNFQATDFVVVKMDIEGGEFSILEKLMDEKHADLIDVLLLECHSWGGSCGTLIKKWQTASGAKMMTENHGYRGWDSESTPEKYYPEDPRK